MRLSFKQVGVIVASVAAVATLTLTLTLSATPALASGAEGEGWPSFDESDGCGVPRMRAPRATKEGFLASSEPVRGPWGDYFGRTIRQIRDDLVYWSVPMSDGERLLVHRRTLPALQEAGASLLKAQAAGKHYLIRKYNTSSYSARTVGGTSKISHHAAGNAVDINSNTNPYSRDNVLRTDMPVWFVDAFRDAGFCWGGDWIDFKDAMHYSWKGPIFTPGYGPPAPVYPPLSAVADFSTRIADMWTPNPASAETVRILADGDGDYAVDVIHINQSGNTVLADVSQARLGHPVCETARYEMPGETLAGKTVLHGDYDGVGGADLWFLEDRGGTARLTVHDRTSDFENATTVDTAVPIKTDDAYLTADLGGDGTVDLFVVRRTATGTRLEAWSRTSGFRARVLNVDTGLGDTRSWSFTFGDRDLDGLPDLFAVDPAGSLTIFNASDGYRSVSEVLSIAALDDPIDVTAADYDGDGRDDLQVLTRSGRKQVFLGNSVIYSDAEGWFETPDYVCTAPRPPPPPRPPETYEGSFWDDEGNVHEASIEIIAAEGITKGCNPPTNDKYCPEQTVTRGQMAAFLVRTLGLTDNGGRNWFVDDGGSVFETDINRLAAAGITKGCNPPANNRFCPDRSVTRQEMAAFLVRAFGYHEGGGSDHFIDDDGSIFEADIDKLATAGVTKGCNPPGNDRYCPGDKVKRDQMASFLARAMRDL